MKRQSSSSSCFKTPVRTIVKIVGIALHMKFKKNNPPVIVQEGLLLNGGSNQNRNPTPTLKALNPTSTKASIEKNFTPAMADSSNSFPVYCLLVLRESIP